MAESYGYKYLRIVKGQKFTQNKHESKISSMRLVIDYLIKKYQLIDQQSAFLVSKIKSML